MTPSRDRVRAMASRVCSAKTMERLVDPVLTDVHIEYQEAIARGRAWRGRWIRLAGYAVLFRAVALYAYERTVRDWSDEAGQAFRRAVLVLALACSSGSLAAMAWGVPAASQAFRLSLEEQLRRTTTAEVTHTKGLTEMSLGELRRRIDTLTQAGRVRQARIVRFAYHLRWGLPCAPFVLALFALAVMPRRPVRYWILAASALGALLSYYLVLLAGAIAARDGTLPSVAAAWLPNLAFVGASAALLVVAARRSSAPARA